MLFYPCHLILYILPNYHINPSIKKLILTFLLNHILLGGALLLIEYLMFLASLSLHVPYATTGIIFNSIGISIPYLVYNYKFITKNQNTVEFLQCFLELGIFKIGFCLGIPWIINCIANLSDHVIWNANKNLGIVSAIYIGLMTIMVIIEMFNGFKIN